MNPTPQVDRRKARYSDVLLKACVFMLSIIVGGLSWGLQQIYITLKVHDKDITELRIELKNGTSKIDSIATDINDRYRYMSIIENRVSVNETKIITMQNTIVNGFDSINRKLDRIIETGILNENKRGRP